jgi:DNA-binding transcriptional ArsR family regulator
MRYTTDVTMFAGLADPTRVRIVELLAEHGEMPAGRVAEHFDMTRAAVSRHLKTLEAGGFVAVREDAQRRLYRLSPTTFVEMDAWLSRYGRFWAQKFATLHHHMEDDP